jgi:hypothetical protein
MNTAQWLDIIVKVLALLVGGFWVLFNYYRGRTHRARLRLSVFAERALLDGLEYLTVKTELTNVGLSRVDASDGCHLTVYAHQLPRTVDIVMEPRWEKLAIYDLYRDQRWVEPNGLLIDQQLVAIPSVAGRFLRVWAHFESPTVGLNAWFIVGPRSAIGGSQLRTTEEGKTTPHH